MSCFSKMVIVFCVILPDLNRNLFQDNPMRSFMSADKGGLKYPDSI